MTIIIIRDIVIMSSTSLKIISARGELLFNISSRMTGRENDQLDLVN